jgi:hypothetical protein
MMRMICDMLLLQLDGTGGDVIIIKLRFLGTVKNWCDYIKRRYIHICIPTFLVSSICHTEGVLI